MKIDGYADNIQHDPLDRLIAGHAARQHGHVTRQQLLDLGASSHAINHRLRAGRLIRVHVGVYAVGHLPATPIGKAAAAVLACGPGALLSHGSAAALWGFQKGWPRAIDVTAKSDRRRPGIQIHRSSTLSRRDATTHHGIRVTSPARTAYDISRDLTDHQLTRTVNDALLSNYLKLSDLAELLQRHPKRDPRLATYLEANSITRSMLEDAFTAFLGRFALPKARLNTHINGREVDALFETAGLIVELDGFGFHSSRASFEDDRERDAEMLVHGLPTVRVTWERLTNSPEHEAERLRAILAARGELLRSSQGPMG
jgi:very-short-patch-repair endonuclease/predicted transcriptional regulator of viral defense system